MTMTNGRIERSGNVHFGDASLAIWEEGVSAARNAGGYKAEKAWERDFKRDVFARIVQQLNRLGWGCAVQPIDPRDVKQYGGKVARWAVERRRTCRKGELQGELSVSGRSIKFEMWQDAQNVENPNGGKYDFDKERRMTYLQRLEMNRTRNCIRDYLCNVFTGYEFQPEKEPKRGPGGVTSLEWIDNHYKQSWHYDSALGRPGGDDHCGNNRSADSGSVTHGARVWFADYHGRILTGTAYYNINNMWWVVTGKYDLNNKASFELYTRQPENLRIKRNADCRRKRLERELQKAVDAMNFERAGVLRDVLFPGAPALFVVWHEEHRLFHSPGFCGYTADKSKAGKFMADEVKGWDRAPNKVMPAALAKEAA
ncbi:UvrB/UvrC motif-containing protein [Cupriavidus basilensis]|uniref:UvrB/UvrC motif-containing protein n=1 Tax=Cupriavidus basilensis TaxID=68895 RepID=UPI0020A64B65|nr:UvrB/UvrC motif-containing protein [Cupriavidus basilensis]MCP3018002.1 UvrB/UvrC motif-containing protein [Cupriavidus basilensis]